MDGCDFISEHVMSALASIRSGDILIIKEIGDPHQYSPLAEMLGLLKISAETPRTETIILLHRTSTASHFDVAHDRPARAPPLRKSRNQPHPKCLLPQAHRLINEDKNTRRARPAPAPRNPLGTRTLMRTTQNTILVPLAQRHMDPH
jgi:hypothetical protein